MPATASWTSRIPDIALRQLPYAAAQGLTQVILLAQGAQREGMGSRFEVRRAPFAMQAVKVTQWPKKSALAGVLAITGPNSDPRRGDIWTKFEAGGDKVAFGGHRYIAVPRTGSIIKRSKRSVVADEHRPAALRDSLTLRTFVRAYKSAPGKLGIFAVDRRHEARLGRKRALLQYGHTRNTLRRDALTGRFIRRARLVSPTAPALRRRARPMLLYALTGRVPIAHRLEFQSTAERTARTELPRAMQAGLAKALAGARWTRGVRTGSVASLLG
jgi:hypothetical protein